MIVINIERLKPCVKIEQIIFNNNKGIKNEFLDR